MGDSGKTAVYKTFGTDGVTYHNSYDGSTEFSSWEQYKSWDPKAATEGQARMKEGSDPLSKKDKKGK